MRKSVRKTQLLAAVVAIVMLAATACGDDDDGDIAADDTEQVSSPTSAEEAPEMQKLTLQLQSVPAGSMSFLYWALEEGLYRDAGIDLEILPGQSSQGTVEAVAEKNVDIGLASGVAVVLGAGNGQDIRSVGHFYGASTFGLFVPGDDRTPEAMADSVEGGSVLTVAGGPQNVLFDAFLEGLDVDPASVSRTNVPITSLIQLYASGEGDGLITVVPFAAGAVQGERPSASILFRDVTRIEPPDTAVVVHPSLLEEQGDLLRRFLQVSYEAMAMQQIDPDATVGALLEAEPTLTPEIAHAELENQLPYVCALGMDGAIMGHTAPEQWESTIERFQAAGLIEQLELGDVHTDEFFERADPASTATC